jgi:hypothetical protein
MYRKYLLSYPPASIAPALLDRLQRKRSRGVAGSDGRSVEIHAAADLVLLQLVDGSQPLSAALPVYVWWSIGGFVCASMAEVDEDERHRSAVVDQVRQAREQLAQARRNRPMRIAAALADAVDVQLD